MLHVNWIDVKWVKRSRRTPDQPSQTQNWLRSQLTTRSLFFSFSFFIADADSVVTVPLLFIVNHSEIEWSEATLDLMGLFYNYNIFIIYFFHHISCLITDFSFSFFHFLLYIYIYIFYVSSSFYKWCTCLIDIRTAFFPSRITYLRFKFKGYFIAS